MISLGYKTYKTKQEIAEAEKEFTRLKKLGHAIVLHEEFDGNRVLLGASSMHYLTCVVCKEQKRRSYEEAEKSKADKNPSSV